MTRQHFIRTVLFLFTVSCGLTGCFWGDEATSNKKLTKDFWLNWWAEPEDQHILRSTDEDGRSGSMAIEQTVFAVGYNDNFIIAKQHPDKEKEIQKRLFNRDSIEAAYLLQDPADTIWLSKDDSVYRKNGKWFHISNGWTPPDSLRPYKRQTFFCIIDVRNYKTEKWDSFKTYKFDNETDFNNKRIELGVPQSLDFTIVDKNLQ